MCVCVCEYILGVFMCVCVCVCETILYLIPLFNYSYHLICFSYICYSFCLIYYLLSSLWNHCLLVSQIPNIFLFQMLYLRNYCLFFFAHTYILSSFLYWFPRGALNKSNQKNQGSGKSHTHTHTHTYIYIYIYACVYVCLHLRLRICVCVYVCVCVCVCVRTHAIVWFRC